MINYKTIHPGIILKRELIKMGLSQKEFASLIGMPPPVLNDIINQRRNITPDIAVLLEKVLFKDSYYWLSLQNDRDIEIAKNKSDYIKKVIKIEEWENIQWYCNTKFIQKYIEEPFGNSINQKIDTILNFFKVETVDNLRVAHNRMFEKYPFYVYEDIFSRKDLFSLYHIALHLNDLFNQPIGIFDKKNHKSIVNNLNTIFYENNDTMSRVTNILTQNGIKPFFIKNIKDTAIGSFSFWLDKTPIVVLIIPEMKIDILAFSLLHELFHVFKCHDNRKKDSLCLSIKGHLNTSQEKEAYDYLTEQLFPTKEWQLFKGMIRHENKYTIHELINDYSKQYHIHPSIVLHKYKLDFDANYLDTSIERMIK